MKDPNIGFRYQTFEDGKILRTPYDKTKQEACGEPWHVATLTGTTLDYASKDAHMKHPAVARHLNSNKVPWELITICGEDSKTFGVPTLAKVVDAAEAANVAHPPTETVTLAPAETPAIIHATKTGMPNIYDRTAMLKWVAENLPNATPFPVLDPSQGDKTPELVVWLQLYMPEEFRRRYGVIGPGYIEAKRIGQNGKTETYRKAVLFATRRTCVTEKPN
jgi:hypothetical protein